MLLALAQCLDMAWAGVDAADYCVVEGPPKIWPVPPYRGGWLVFLKGEKGQRIIVPAGVGYETLPDGNILLTATEEIFDRDNKAHRAAAARLQRGLDPLNDK